MSRKSIRLKIFLARLLVVVMVVTSIPFYQKQEAKAAGNLLWSLRGQQIRVFPILLRDIIRI